MFIYWKVFLSSTRNFFVCIPTILKLSGILLLSIFTFVIDCSKRLLVVLTSVLRELYLLIRIAFTRTPNTNANFRGIKFKHQFKSINFYSIPESVLIILRRRLLFIYAMLYLFTALLFTIL